MAWTTSKKAAGSAKGPIESISCTCGFSFMPVSTSTFDSCPLPLTSRRSNARLTRILSASVSTSPRTERRMASSTSASVLPATGTPSDWAMRSLCFSCVELRLSLPMPRISRCCAHPTLPALAPAPPLTTPLEAAAGGPARCGGNTVE